ncbi:VirB4 family type IV secretion system protein [Chakrabartyella piscis]|uniref:VirB4 family type IV secretion system protein n=1 Tax=Chakrabartyella piscis TaxID=2918914 RepID=UPI0029586701|nr:ATP-binding protein [Chakrabartyella piscis]
MPKNQPTKARVAEPKIKTFLDMIAPSVVKFNVDHFICGNTFRCVYALREYPTATNEQAILRHLGEKDGVTLRIYTRQVTATEEKRIIHNAANKNRMNTTANNLQDNITAQENLNDVANLVSTMHRNREPLLHCAVYIELIADSLDELKLLQTDVLTELVRSKLNVDRLNLRQQDGFLSVMPSGRNVFADRFERVLPASSVANLYPFNYSGKTDKNGFYLGRDKFGSNIIVDFDERADDKTNANILILGNSGQGKSYLLKLILCNVLESGKSVICLDPEMELQELAENLDGCFIDLMSGEYIINPLEPKTWDEGNGSDDEDAPITFRQKTKLSQHISFLKDFFRTYKDFTDSQIDVIEILLSKLYSEYGITDATNFRRLKPTDYPTLENLYDYIFESYKEFNDSENALYTKEMLQEILLGLHSMCKGAESKFFSGHTNIASDRFIVFGVKGLLQASKNVKNAMLFNVLSFMSDKLLTEGHTAAAIDELYLFLTNITAIEYIRNFMKRVRKKESAVILASQNLEDFAVQGIAELTKPLFSIPTHQFLFNAGAIDKRFYIDTLQLEDSEYNLIKFPQRGVCLFKCGNERYNLAVHAPKYKEQLFGKAGGR